MFFLKNIFNTFLETVNFKTRASRKQFNFYLLYLFVLIIISSFYLFVQNTFFIFASSFSIKIFIISLIPFLSLSVRRLHDINLSGGWALIYIPIFFIFDRAFFGLPLREVSPIFSNVVVALMWILNLVLVFRKSFDSDNKYGKKVP